MSNILDAFKEKQVKKKVYNGKKIRVGIIGCGWIAEAHLKSYLKCDDVEVVAFADLIPGKAEAFAKQNGVENANFYLSDKELIDNEKELDAVSVCTYNREHAGPTIYALKHGVNVLLEKPMCVTLDEAVEICKAEKESGKILSIGFQPRFDENMKMVKKICESGVLEVGSLPCRSVGQGVESINCLPKTAWPPTWKAERFFPSASSPVLMKT